MSKLTSFFFILGQIQYNYHVFSTCQPRSFLVNMFPSIQYKRQPDEPSSGDLGNLYQRKVKDGGACSHTYNQSLIQWLRENLVTSLHDLSTFTAR